MFGIEGSHLWVWQDVFGQGQARWKNEREFSKMNEEVVWAYVPALPLASCVASLSLIHKMGITAPTSWGCIRILWDNAYEALSPGLTHSLHSVNVPPSFLSSSRVTSDQWSVEPWGVRLLLGDCRVLLPALTALSYLRSELDKSQRVGCTNCRHFGPVLIVKTPLVPLLREKWVGCASYSFPCGDHFTIYMVFLHSCLYLDLHNNPMGYNRGVLSLQFKEKYQCSERPSHLSEGTQSRKGTRLQPQL